MKLFGLKYISRMLDEIQELIFGYKEMEASEIESNLDVILNNMLFSGMTRVSLEYMKNELLRKVIIREVHNEWGRI